MQPRYLYHAAPICVASNIMEEGLRSNFGEVYAASSPEDALTFMSFRLLHHYHGPRDFEYEGRTITIPNIVEHPSIHVWEIDTRYTSKWAEGTDHNPECFGEATSWVHKGNVDVSALKAFITYTPEGATP